MLQDLFLHMHRTLQELEDEFDNVGDIDQELTLLEKYLTVKEMSEDITDELQKLNAKIKQFELEHGLLEMGLEAVNHHQEETKSINENQNNKEKPDNEEEVVIEIEEDDFLAFQKGIGFFDLWMYQDAVNHLQQIIEKYIDFNLARLYLAMAYYKKKDFELAKQHINLLFEYSDDPDLLSLGYNIIGMINGHENNHVHAINNFQQAIKLKEKWNEPRFNLAIMYYQMKDYHKAIQLLEDLYTPDTKDWEVIFYLGKAYQKLNQTSKANDFFKQTYTITKQPEIIKQIANQFEKRRQFKEAIYWYRKYLNIEPNNPAIYLKLGQNMWLNNDKDTGLLLVKKAISLDPYHVDALLFYAWIYSGKDKEKILARMEHTAAFQLEEQKNNTSLIANLARLYYLNKDDDRAEKFSYILLESNSSLFRGLGHLVKGLSYLDKEQPEQSLAEFEYAINEGIVFPYLDFYRGYNHYLLGNLEKAKNYWSKLTNT